MAGTIRRLRGEALWQLATRYARLYGWAKDRWDIRLKGVSRLLRMVGEDRTFDLAGSRFQFDHRVAGSYDLMVIGRSNEPETGVFLGAVLEASPAPVTFIDVGANVGEFLITMAAHPRVQHAWGFEPHPHCAEACRRSAALNGLTNVTVLPDLVGDGSARPFLIDPRTPNGSAIRAGGQLLQTARLDDVLGELRDSLIMLIDVEGAEPLVLEGARGLIARAQPLIVFEYNHVSRQQYRLEQVRAILGPAYVLHRLRRDGRLDADLESSWNAVAVPRGSMFERICAELVA